MLQKPHKKNTRKCDGCNWMLGQHSKERDLIRPVGQGLVSWALESDWLDSNPDLPVTVGALGPYNLN